MARIAIGGFQHETNCFVASRTDFAYFADHRDRPPLVYGADVVEWLTGTTFALAGFLQDMQAKHDLVPLLWTSGGAGGMVTRDAFERIAGSLVGRLSEALPVDAVIRKDGSLAALAGEVHRVLYCVLVLPLVEGVAA